SPAWPSSGGAGVSRSMGGIRTPLGTTAGRIEGGVLALVDFGEGGRGKGRFSPFTRPSSPAFAPAFSPAFSPALNATSGCHPTVSRPRADRANSPTSTPPAVPTAWCTPWARAAGNTPTSFAVGPHVR